MVPVPQRRVFAGLLPAGRGERGVPDGISDQRPADEAIRHPRREAGRGHAADLRTGRAGGRRGRADRRVQPQLLRDAYEGRGRTGRRGHHRSGRPEAVQRHLRPRRRRQAPDGRGAGDAGRGRDGRPGGALRRRRVPSAAAGGGRERLPGGAGGCPGADSGAAAAGAVRPAADGQHRRRHGPGRDSGRRRAAGRPADVPGQAAEGLRHSGGTGGGRRTTVRRRSRPRCCWWWTTRR